MSESYSTYAHDYEETLAEFFEEELITEVIQVVKSGKEGTVYCCRATERTGHELLAAKIYRSSEHRMFHNSSAYREGQWIPDSRLRRAIANKSRMGRSFQADDWVGHEYRTLELLYETGSCVPKPIARSGQAVLMSYVGDENSPAPLLQHAAIDSDHADPLFRRLLHEIERWLSCGRVHADLSPFNILYWEGEPTVIDFPQAVDPETNPNAFAMLTRDIGNLCRFFARFGIRAEPEPIANNIWRRQRERVW